MGKKIFVDDEPLSAVGERISYESWFRQINCSEDERHRAMLDVIQSCIAHDLTSRQREVYHYLIEKQMPAVQVAKKLGVHVSTVYRTRDRGLEKIRYRLGVLHLLSYLF